MKNDHANLMDRNLSELAHAAPLPSTEPSVTRNSLPVLWSARTTLPVTLDLVNQLRDETLS